MEQSGRAGAREMLGRAGEAWGAESGNDRLLVVIYPQLHCVKEVFDPKAQNVG